MIVNNGMWVPNLSGVEQYVEEYSKPLLPAHIENTEETDWQVRHRKREEEREETRIRIRSSSGSNAYFHKGRPIPTLNDKDNKRVAVYARVSTTSTDQTSSIENQQIYYTKKIDENENWEMQEIYSDEGKSGMEVKHRTEFLRMIDDAKKGRMDMIICASVSRFARDISDCIKYITKLRTMNPLHPVGVFFETENLYTLDPNSEQVLHFHAMLAHWESANKSRRMILSYDQRICTGQYPVSDLLGYRHTKDGRLVIHPEEEKTVRFVFLSLVAGYSCTSIAEKLTEKKRSTLKGNMEWNCGMVLGLLGNERRWGDLEARKTIVLDPRKKVVVRNNGIRDWAFVPEHHEGIVTPGIAKAARFMASSHGRLPGGVPEFRVIREGALKGFVSICPRWRGIDRKTILDACRSVYNDRELSELEREIRIWSGLEESDVLSAALTGYEVPRGILFLTRSMPAMTITNRSVKFNQPCHNRLGGCEWVEMLYHPVMKEYSYYGFDEFIVCAGYKQHMISMLGRKHEISVGRDVVRALGNPDYVCLLMNDAKHRIALQVCDARHPMSFKVPSGFLKGIRYCKFRIYSMDFTGDLVEKYQLDRNVRYALEGWHVEEHHAVVFSLKCWTKSQGAQ